MSSSPGNSTFFFQFFIFFFLNGLLFQKFLEQFQKFLEWQTIKKKLKLDVYKKKSGAAGTRTHGRGSVPLMSKSDAIPLRHEAETVNLGFYYEFI